MYLSYMLKIECTGGGGLCVFVEDLEAGYVYLCCMLKIECTGGGGLCVFVLFIIWKTECTGGEGLRALPPVCMKYTAIDESLVANIAQGKYLCYMLLTFVTKCMYTV